MRPRFSVAVEDRDRDTLVRPEGELDLATAAQLEAVLDRCADGRPLTVDLRGLEFLDCSGLRCLLELAARRKRLSVIPGDERVQRVIDITGVQDQLPLAARMRRAA